MSVLLHVLLSTAVKCFATVAECGSISSSDFFVADSLEACCLDSRGFFARPNGSNDAICNECIGESPYLRVTVKIAAVLFIVFCMDTSKALPVLYLVLLVNRIVLDYSVDAVAT